MEINDSVIIVTGASSGIGEAIARSAHARGMRVVLAARRGDLLSTLAGELPGSLAVPTDVTDTAQVEHLVRATLDAFGRIDVLVNNAGQGLHVPVEDVDVDDLRAVLELNVLAPLSLMQAVVPEMRARGRGAVVNISSGTTKHVFPGVGPYAATKAALNTLTDVARAELARDGITVSLVVPAVVDTAFHERLRAGAAHLHGVPKCTPQQVADAVLQVIETGEPEVSVLP